MKINNSTRFTSFTAKRSKKYAVKTIFFHRISYENSPPSLKPGSPNKILQTGNSEISWQNTPSSYTKSKGCSINLKFLKSQLIVFELTRRKERSQKSRPKILGSWKRHPNENFQSPPRNNQVSIHKLYAIKLQLKEQATKDPPGSVVSQKLAART